MTLLIIGLIVFLGIHSCRMLAPDWRNRQVERLGTGGWKALFSVVALAGLVLIVMGYGQARMDPLVLWTPPAAMRHLALLLTVPAFVFLVAAYVPGNALRARLGHPMLIGVKTWAIAHLLANGTLADVLLFGSFLAWAVAGFAVSRRRDRAAGVAPGASSGGATVMAVVLGLVLWVVFMFQLHFWLIGVSPLTP